MSDDGKTWHEVCSLDEIGDPGAFGFKTMAGEHPVFGFVVQKNGQVYGYKNSCPHAGRPLDWAPHAFLTKTKEHIMCSAHGAMFELENGLCVGGPCLGRSLAPWNVEVRDNTIYAEPPPVW
ncbi:MAG: Rieske (2Fe-2S) protein [Pseudomonadota bacterium]